MKKVVIASDSFKGTLSSEQIIELTKEVIRDNKLDIELKSFIVADGGEGTVDAYAAQFVGRKKCIRVKDANGNYIEAYYFIYGHRAIIEVASAISLPNTKIKNPLKTSTYGVGQLIKDAIKEGSKEIIVGLGGSSTNDGGMGMLSALGVKFYDENNELIDKFANEDLNRIHHFDKTECDVLIRDTTILGMCDVKNPLLGEQGATYVFAPQKGANEQMLPILEANMSYFANVVRDNLGFDYSHSSGAGAAGGLGFALISLLNAKLKSGINLLLESLNFDKEIQKADLVISGEGRLDSQSFSGKVIDGISRSCEKENVPLTLIVGSIEKDFDTETLKKRNIKEVVIASNNETTFEEIRNNASSNYKNVLCKVLQSLTK